MKELTVIIQERPLVLLGLSLLGHLVFNCENVSRFELCSLFLESVFPDILPICAVLPSTYRSLPLLELSERLVS